MFKTETISEGGITYLLFTKTKTAKVLQHQDVTGSITIKSFISYKSINYIIQEIEDEAFSGAQIESLSFGPNSQVKRIGNFVFQQSTIQNIDIPDSLEEFGENWCFEVKYLTNININDNHKYFKYENGILTTKNGEKIIFAKRDISTLTFPENVKEILPSAFYSCKNISSFILKSSMIESIGPYAFRECTELKNILIGDENVHTLTLGKKCFSYCEHLLNIILRCNTLILKENCFECCISISGLTFPVKHISFCQSSISGCTSLSSLCISNADQIDIQSKSFISLPKLSSIFLKADQFNIFNDSFEKCESIESIYSEFNNNSDFIFLGVFDSLKAINLVSHSGLELKSSLFTNTRELVIIELKSNNLVLEDECFNHLEKLSFIKIECENQMNFSHKLFIGCNRLKSFKFIQENDLNRPEKVNLDEKCFFYAKNLEEIEISADDVNIGNSCFYCLKNLRKVALQGKNMTIGENAFEECDSIKSFKIVTDKINIEKECFNIAENLNEVDIKANEINLGVNSFSNTKNLKKVTLQCQNVRIMENCFSNSSVSSLMFLPLENIEYVNQIKLNEHSFLNSKLTEIDIAANEINFGSNCFNGSQNLQKVSLHSKNITIDDNCFTQCNSLWSFTVLEIENIGITEIITINEKSFFNSKLTEVNIVANDINLGSNCFNGSQKLREIALHGKNITIDDNCFAECNSLQSFKISELEENVFTEKIVFAEKCFFNARYLRDIEISANYINFSNSCFSGSQRLKNAVFHCKNVTIGDNCFTECNSFQSFNITNLLITDESDKITFGKGCFCNLMNLREIDIKANKIIVGDNCFTGALNLQKVLFKGTSVTFSNHCFNNCNSLCSFTVKYKSSFSIGSQQFTQCSRLKTISITNDVFSSNTNFALKEFTLADDCFIGADKITDLEIFGETIKISNELLNYHSISTLQIISKKDVEISNDMFNDSTNLKKIIIYSKLLTIKQNCFNRNNCMQNIYFCCSSIYFHSNCFNNIYNCQLIQFRNVHHMTFDSNDFCNWKNLTNCEIKTFDSLNIGPRCFIHFERLNKISFFSKKVMVGSESFQECTSLKSVNLAPIANTEIDISTSYIPKCKYPEEVKIGERAFNLCKNLKEFNVTATKEVIICDECFYNLQNLYKININAKPIIIGKNCFYNCPGLKNTISVDEPENESSLISYIMKDLDKNVNQINAQFKNERRFDSFFVLGIDSFTKKPTYISMFPADPVTLDADNIKFLPSFCYPQGAKKIPSRLPNQSNIITGFVFYVERNKYVGVALHICIPLSANSFVGKQFDRSYPFCICLVSSNPDIPSHFSFLYDIVDPIVGKTVLPEEKVIIPVELRNREENCIFYLHISPYSNCIALDPTAQSMNFLLPKLLKYYKNPFQKYKQNESILYPTLQTLLTFLQPIKIVELFFCLICDLHIVFISEDLNKLSFCILALVNLVKNIDIRLIFPCLPLNTVNIVESPVPYIIGFNKKGKAEDIDVNLDTGEISFQNEGETMYSVIHTFVNETGLNRKIENLFNENINNILIPAKSIFNSRYTEFIKNADNDIYPENFQFFVKTKYILTKKIIKDFVELIEKPFFIKVKKFIRDFLKGKSANQDENISILNYVDSEYIEIMKMFITSQTYIYIKEILEDQIKLIKIPTKPEIEHDSLDFQNPLTKSKSCPSLLRNKLNNPRSKKNLILKQFP